VTPPETSDAAALAGARGADDRSARRIGDEDTADDGPRQALSGRVLYIDRLDGGTIELWAGGRGFDLNTFDRHRDSGDRHGRFDRLSDAIPAALALAADLRGARQ
jgi:hypothetical protein